MKTGSLIIIIAFMVFVSYGSILLIKILEPNMPSHLVIVAGIIIAASAGSIMACRGILVEILQGIADELKEQDDED
jgi:hypothetical protein